MASVRMWRRKFALSVLLRGSPLSLAALAGVSPALPQGEPSLRPWAGRGKPCGKINFSLLCLTTNFAKIDAGTLASPRGGGGTALCAVTERGGSHACGTAQLRRCLRQKQPKRSRGSGLSFARAQRRPKQKQGTATVARRAGEGQAHPAEQKQKTPPSGLG